MELTKFERVDVSDWLLLGEEPAGLSEQREGHSLENIQLALHGLRPPPGCDLPAYFGAFEVFCWYLVLDALVANRDRHDYNWAIVIPPSELGVSNALRASYDHASSLGFNLRDDERERRLSDGSLRTWASNGTAWRFEHPAPPGKVESLVSLAVRGLTRCHPQARQYVLRSLTTLVEPSLADILHRTPQMSSLAATFAKELMLLNRQRLLDAATLEEHS